MYEFMYVSMYVCMYAHRSVCVCYALETLCTCTLFIAQLFSQELVCLVIASVCVYVYVCIRVCILMLLLVVLAFDAVIIVKH
jgi:hypothetical protein